MEAGSHRAALLARRGLVPHLHRPKPRGKPLPPHRARGNASRTRVRVAIEQVFAQKCRLGLVLVGGTGSGKTHLAVGIARACIRGSARGRLFNVVDLVNKLDAEARAGRQGRLADHLCRLDFVILDELGYMSFAQTGGQLLFHLISRLYRIKVALPTCYPHQQSWALLAGRAIKLPP